jgi:hypothetical protein
MRSLAPGVGPARHPDRYRLPAARRLGGRYGTGLAWLPVAARPTSSTAVPPTSFAPVSSASSSPSSSPSPSSTLPPRHQAANALAALLVQSGKDRASITQAVTSVEDCSANLGQDETVFSDAASSRQALLGKLIALPDGSALPASMLPDLTTAWQASSQADQDFARWTQDEISQDAARTTSRMPTGRPQGSRTGRLRSTSEPSRHSGARSRMSTGCRNISTTRSDDYFRVSLWRLSAGFAMARAGREFPGSVRIGGGIGVT